MARKHGRLNAEEVDFINDNKNRLTPAQIALQLNRRPGVISDWIAKNGGISKPQKIMAEAKFELKTKPYYSELQKQFTNEELKTFEHHYIQLYNQFKEDVFYTEEIQIIDICKNEILCNRNLRNQSECRDQIESIEYDIQIHKRGPRDLWDIDYLDSMNRQLATLRASTQNMSVEYKELMARKSALLKEVKGTRDQLRKNMEDTKQTFGALLTRLNSDYEYRKNVGLDMEKYRIAMEAERERLSKKIVYEDGVQDRPLLNSESILKDK